MHQTAENVGAAFSDEGMLRAREATRRAIRDIAAMVRPGMLEEDAVAQAQQILLAQGHARSWHPTRVRFGQNTMKAMKLASTPGVILQEDDIFFIDIAPRVDAWEGDGGASFTVGSDARHERCARDAQTVFHEVRKVWREHQLSGQGLYRYATQRAQELGWELNMDLPGHRVSDFPHAAIHTGSLAEFDAAPQAMRWILEIHLRDPAGEFGAFFEDMLLDDQHYDYPVR